MGEVKGEVSPRRREVPDEEVRPRASGPLRQGGGRRPQTRVPRPAKPRRWPQGVLEGIGR